MEKLCDLCNITVNKNAVFGDSSALAPGGVRVGKKLHMNLSKYCIFSDAYKTCLHEVAE